MLTHRLHRGFTLIEVMVALTILALMFLLTLPSMNTYFQNSRIGSAAQTFAAGLQVARAEAIRRNTQVQFLLTDTDVSTADIANVAVPSATGRNWVVRVFNPATGTFDPIETKSALEGSGQAPGSIPNVSVVGVAIAPAAAFDGTVTFNGFGGTTSIGEIQLGINNLAGGQCAPAGSMRCLNVRTAPGGQVRVCDPLALLGDSRACL